jgi:DNA replication protein DnaC
MAAAVIDRVVHHGRLLQFKGESYRVRHALMQ